MTLSRHLLLAVSLSLVWLPLAAQTTITPPALVGGTPIPAQSLGINGTAASFNVSTYIYSPDVTGTAVQMTVQIGNLSTGVINLALYDQLTPITVANFLAYINAGYFTNDIIHRSVPGFIIQGGEYYFNAPGSLSYVPTSAPIQNEFAGSGLSNVAGTIAMALSGNDANSATSQWFINLVDNSANLNYQNGGFTVFGQIVGNGLAVANAVAALTTYNGTSIAPDWTNIPLTSPNITNSNGFIMSAFVSTSSVVVPALTFTASSSNTSLVNPSLSGNTLTLTPSATLTGNANITVTATDLTGTQTSFTFVASVLSTYSNWVAPYNLSPSAALATANPAGDGVPNLLKFAFGGNPTLAQRAPGLPEAESGGGVTFYQRQLAGLSYEVDESPDLVTWTKIWQTSDGLAAAPVALDTTVAGFDVLTIRDPSGGFQPLRFWRVQVSATL